MSPDDQAKAALGLYGSAGEAFRVLRIRYQALLKWVQEENRQ